MPLTGVTVLDLSQYGPGRYAAQLLGDFGADVIAVEAPAARAGADRANDGVSRSRRNGTNPTFRSRRSIGLDLKSDAGREVLLRLAEGSDVLLEGFRPGTTDRLGVGYEAVAARSPRLVYCSLTGYGQDGPDAGRAGHDLNYIAETGLLSLATRPGQRPGIPGGIVADYAAGGLQTAFAILAALRERDRTGRGMHLDVSMVGGLLSLLAAVESWRDAGDPDASWGGGLVSGAAPFYDCYATADGGWLSVAPLEAPFFRSLCEELERPDLIELQGERERWPELRAELEAVFATQPLAVWLERLGPNTCTAPVLSVGDAFAQARARGEVHDVARVQPIGGLPYRDERPVVRTAGAHTREVLRERGWSEAEVDELLAAGAAYAEAEAVGLS
jgi:alpha-methylacyl-CoA racemase